MRILIASLLACAMMALATADDPTDHPDHSNSTDHTDSTEAPEMPCFSGWNNFEGRSFCLIIQPLRWGDAEMRCQSKGAHLASVHSKADYENIQQLVFNASGGYPEAWIGGSDAAQEGIWLWSDGSRFDHPSWCDGQPDNNGACTQINFSDDHCGGSTECSKYLAAVCAKKLE